MKAEIGKPLAGEQRNSFRTTRRSLSRPVSTVEALLLAASIAIPGCASATGVSSASSHRREAVACSILPDRDLKCGKFRVSEGVLTEGTPRTFYVTSPNGETTSFGADYPTRKRPIEISEGSNILLILWDTEQSKGPNPRGEIVYSKGISVSPKSS